MILKFNLEEEEKIKNILLKELDKRNIKYQLIQLAYSFNIALWGDLTDIDELLEGYKIIEKIETGESFLLTSRKYKSNDTKIKLNSGHIIGSDELSIISGPCAVESREQIINLAKDLKEIGVDILRGGAFKPRTSPYSFQGKGFKALDWLVEAGEITGLPVVSEILDPRDIERYQNVDILQIGARNSQNYPLLKEVGKTDKPIILKRGLAGTIEELLMSAEYIMAEGNSEIILCERGIRTYEELTRNTLDISIVPVLKKLTHLPVIIDPSHGVGLSEYISNLALAGAAAGADGLMIEAHNTPELALSDGDQAIMPNELEDIIVKAKAIREIIWK